MRCAKIVLLLLGALVFANAGLAYNDTPYCLFPYVPDAMERIGGLPVRKIMPVAFSLCQSLTSVSIPSTVREVGERAFRCSANSVFE